MNTSQHPRPGDLVVHLSTGRALRVGEAHLTSATFLTGPRVVLQDGCHVIFARPCEVHPAGRVG